MLGYFDKRLYKVTFAASLVCWSVFNVDQLFAADRLIGLHSAQVMS